MGDMAFGGGFELLRDGDVNGLWKTMVDRIECVHSLIHSFIPLLIANKSTYPSL